MKSSKKVCSDAMDRISELPDGILIHILSLLETIDAVRTCILARRWQCLWKSIHSLNFHVEDIKRKLFPEITRTYTVEFRAAENGAVIEFINRVLLLNDRSTIQNFSLYWFEEDDEEEVNEVFVDGNTSAIDSWISSVVSRNIESIRLSLINSSTDYLSPSLFTCDTLTVLKLKKCGRSIKLPCTIHLPKLKTLKITFATFCDENTARQLLSSCPVLEELSIKHCFLPYNSKLVDISSPSLKKLVLKLEDNDYCLSLNAPALLYFRLGGYLYGSPIIKLLSLEEIDMGFVHFGYESSGEEAVSQILNSVHMVRRLILSGTCSEILEKNFESTGSSPFLRLLYLCIGVSYTKPSLEFLAHLISTNRQLEHLVVYMTDEDEVEELDDLIMSNSMENLRIFEMIYFEGTVSEFRFLKYVLGTQLRLEKIIVKSRNPKNLEEISSKLSEYPRISPEVSILIS